VDFLNYGWSVGNVADIWLMVAGIGIVALIVTGEPFSKADLARLDETQARSDAQQDGGKDASEGGDTL
ncbi:signal peptidase II, partial [Bifidobacterium amazonense]|nr:signal peptidase II [Bifidobacterium amazonense]